MCRTGSGIGSMNQRPANPERSVAISVRLASSVMGMFPMAETKQSCGLTFVARVDDEMNPS